MTTFPSSPPHGGPPRSWTFPTMVSKVLPSGVEVAAIRMPALPIVQVRWSFRGGRRDESLEAVGSSRLLQSVMRHGTRSYDSAALAGTLDHIGARLHISMACDSAMVCVSALTSHLSQALDLADEVAFEPSLPVDAIDRERAKALEVHRHDRLQPEALAGTWLAWRLYGTHPYGRPGTTEAGLAATDRELLSSLHATVFHPGHGLILVVGDVDPDAVVARLSERYGSLSGKGPHPQPPSRLEPPPMKRSATLVERPRSQQTAIALGMAAPARVHPNYLALRLANQVFGGGASSRLFMELRERQSLTYGAYSMLDSGLWGGDLTASMNCAGDKTLQAVRGLTTEVERMSAGTIERDDLDHARRFLIGSFPQRASGVAGVAALANAGWLHGLGEDTWSRYQSDIADVSEQDVIEAARRWFQPELSALVVVGASDALDLVEGPLSDAGLPVERTDLADTRFEGMDLD